MADPNVPQDEGGQQRGQKASRGPRSLEPGLQPTSRAGAQPWWVMRGVTASTNSGSEMLGGDWSGNFLTKIPTHLSCVQIQDEAEGLVQL